MAATNQEMQAFFDEQFKHQVGDVVEGTFGEKVLVIRRGIVTCPGGSLPRYYVRYPRHAQQGNVAAGWFEAMELGDQVGDPGGTLASFVRESAGFKHRPGDFVWVGYSPEADGDDPDDVTRKIRYGSLRKIVVDGSTIDDSGGVFQRFYSLLGAKGDVSEVGVFAAP